MWPPASFRTTRASLRGCARVAAACIGLGGALGSQAAPVDNEPIRLCGTAAQQVPAASWQAAELRPVEPDLSRDAFLAALVSQVSRVPVSVVYMASWRCLQEAAAGRLDGVLAISPLPQRLASLSFPHRDGQLDRERRISTFAYHWYVRRDEGWQYGPARKLTGPRQPTVGVVTGYSVTTLLEADGYRVEPVAGGTLTALRQVARSRLDVAMLIDTEAVLALDKEAELAQRLQQLTPAYTVRDYYLVFSPDTMARRPDTVQRIWNAMPQVREAAQRWLGGPPASR